jgi:hypothetical protein
MWFQIQPYFNADPDPEPAFHFTVDPIRIRIVLLFLIKVMGFCDH